MRLRMILAALVVLLATGLVAQTFRGTILGTVTDASTQAPIANVSIQVFDSSDNFVTAAVTLSDGSYTITGLVSGHQYDLAVASINAAGDGAWGGAPAAFAGQDAPAAPMIWAASTTQLTWPCVSFATGYWGLLGHRHHAQPP